MAPEVEVELAREPVAISAGDTLLLATDGLTDLLSDAEPPREATPPAARPVCQELVALANARGGHDNINRVQRSRAPAIALRVPDPTYVDVNGDRARYGAWRHPAR
jgi:hypothetical protein